MGYLTEAASIPPLEMFKQQLKGHLPMLLNAAEGHSCPGWTDHFPPLISFLQKIVEKHKCILKTQWILNLECALVTEPGKKRVS